MPIYPNRSENPLDANPVKIPDSIYKRAKEKETLEWLYKNAAAYEKKYGLPSGVLLALAGHESAHYQKAVASGTGPKGLFQLAERTARAYGLNVGNGIDDRLDLSKSTDAAARLLKDNLKQHKGDVLKALAQYNGGSRAPDFTNGRTHLYDPGNGNPGELYGFLRGVANYAREWGNQELYDRLYPSYSERRQEVIRMKEKLQDKGYDVKVDGSWNKKLQTMWDEAKKVHHDLDPENFEIPEPAKAKFIAPVDIPDSSDIQGPKNPAEPEQETIADPPKKTEAPNKPAETKRDPKEVRVYEGGGRLVQKANGSEDLPLQGEERIYSIPDTKKIVEMATSAESEEDLRKLGEFVYKATKKQDEKDPEMTED